MNLKETVEFTLPVTKKKVVVRGYATGRIKQAISAVYLSGTTLETKAGQVDSSSSINGMVGQEATNKAFELMVLSVDGNSDNVLDAILDLPEEDYDAVKEKVDEVRAPLAPKSETTSQTASTTPSTEA